jgi:hypothetical protein
MKGNYKIRLLLGVLIVASLSAPAQTLSDLQEQWRTINAMPPPRKFDQLIPKLVEYREKAGGRDWRLNYMLGSSYCRLTGQEQKGKIALHRVLGSYGLPDAARAAAEKVLADCGRESTVVQEPSVTIVPISGQTGAVVHGKGGYELRIDSKSATTRLQASPVPVAELQKRTFRREKSAEAVRAAVERAAFAGSPGARLRGAFVDPFVVTSALDMPPEETGRCLVRYRSPLEMQFRMQMPADLITVYVVDPEELPGYAVRLHGVKLPLETVAYSVFQDLSIVGVSSYMRCGSLGHELVHLAIRQNFGDCPAWLEEGLASEVAVSTPEHSRFVFGRSWRDSALDQHWNLRPSVSELLKRVWPDYAANDESQVERVAALHAMAASFIRYLDAKQRLQPVYFSMRDSLSLPQTYSDEEILQKELGMSLEQIDADFVRWFGHTTH